ncbi:MAG: LysE family translocator [Alcaligenaceae bacterium]|nr:MAG: LysE family translocator [Alcaligenaceae bacterium]
MDPNPLFSAPILLAWATYFVGVASPGPSIMAIMSVAMGSGRQAALIFAGGVASGAFFWAVTATLGVSAAIAAYPPIISAIKIAGGLYFLWLGYRAARSAWRARVPAAPIATAKPHAYIWLYVRGLLMHLTNPKAILIWTSIVAMGANVGITRSVSGAGALAAQVASPWLVTVGCMLIGTTVFASYALLFSTARARRIYAACQLWLDAGLAVMFVLAGISLLSTSI